MAFLNDQQFLDHLYLHHDPPHLNHCHHNFLMLQELYIHHTKNKVYLSDLILDCFLQLFFLLNFLLTAPSPFLSLLIVLEFDKVFDVDAIFDVDSPSEEETSSV